MKITRVYTGPDNTLHFEDINIPLKDGGAAGYMAELGQAPGVIFRETDGSYNFDFSNTPRRQDAASFVTGHARSVDGGSVAQ